jgi:predicted phosphodiesterase
MRVFAISDLHLDYAANREWLQQLPMHEYNDDVLILAGDVSDRLTLLEDAFGALTRRFSAVLFVPGNHDLWINRERLPDSFAKLDAVLTVTREHGVRTDIYREGDLAIVPLLGWYDYSFGTADDYLKAAWADYRNCLWPGHDETSLTRFFTEQNPTPSSAALQGARRIITFSHFLPRIDLMPERIPEKHRKIYPVLGTSVLERQLRKLGSSLHVYGHSHVNRHVTIDGVTYINNAFGYPSEAHFTGRQLMQVW